MKTDPLTWVLAASTVVLLIVYLRAMNQLEK